MRCITDSWVFETAILPEHTYRWDFGDNDSAFGAMVTKNFTAAGKYDVQLFVENEHGCSNSSEIITIHVEALPEPDYYTEIVAEGIIRFHNITNYHDSNTQLLEWTILDDAYDYSPVEISFPDMGEFPIVLTARNDRCSATHSSNIMVTQIGVLDFSIENSVLCQGAELRFINESEFVLGGITFEWEFGDGGLSSEENPVKAYHDDETTVYSVTLRAIDANNTGWSASLTREITVLRPPRINWGGNIFVCDDNWLLKPEEVGAYYLWSNGSTMESLNVTRSDTYWLQLTGNNGCVSRENVNIVLNSAVVPTISDTQSCGRLTLDAGNPGSEYLWNNGSTARTLLVEENGTYSVTVTQPNGCTGSKTVQIEIIESPEVKVLGTTTLCYGATATLHTAEEANTSYLWNTGSTASSTEIFGEGWYRVTATNLNTMCVASDSIYVISQSSPRLDLGGDRNVCLGQETILEMNDYYYATAVEWWKEGDVQIHEGRSFAVSDVGTYFLRVTLANGCSTTEQIRFNGVVTPLIVDFLAASMSNVGDTVVFIDLSYPEPIIDRNWDLSTGFRTSEPIFQYAFWNEGVYTVKLTVDNGGCALSNTKSITVGTELKSGGDGSNDAQGNGGGSEIFIDDVSEKPLYREPSKIIEAIAFPNPGDGDIQVQVKLARPSRLLARLYTITGQAVTSFVVPEQTEEALFRCNFTNLPAGVYLLQIHSEDDVRTVRVVIN